MEIQYCRRCHCQISKDEIGITKKLINRGTEKYFCISCLAEAFEVEKRDIEEKIDFYKKMGCTLFQ